ncbi:MAG TPA: GNAT family protein [Gaiellaceae bacterium]|nr:GNAT family protein [Gaiellaceae bacterium]
MPRRLKAPDPPLQDGVIRLDRMARSDTADLLDLVQDASIKEFTMVPTNGGESFVRSWIRRYDEGWRVGDRAGFVVRGVEDDAFLGFASMFRLDLPAREGEIGYAVAPAARGRGVAVRALELLTGWGFDELGLERLELRIAVTNPASERVAERGGYRCEGVLRSVHFKEGRRIDVGVWSRLRDDARTA